MKLLISLITSVLFFLPKIPVPTPVIFHSYPSSDLSVNWNSPSPDFVIFNLSDMLPGDSQNHSVTITSSDSQPRPLSVIGTKTSETENFSQILTVTIFKENTPLYGPKTLSRFFIDSASPSGISLGNLSAHASAAYKFLVTFPSAAGNDYQQAEVVFDLKIGKLLDIPDKCRRFHDDDGHDFICDYSHKKVFTSFDREDRIDDRDFNRCTTIK
jgi:hypothetical protein